MYEYKAVIVRVVDGDTVDIDIDLGFRITTRQRVRLAGINAPETSTPEGVTAKTFLAELIPVGTKVIVDSDKPGAGDKYGRFLASIFLNGKYVGDSMIEAGHAVAWDGTGVKPT